MEDLYKIAEQALEFAYAPYSKFKVGAALLCEDGKIYTGCNVENGAYGATICAERCAFVKAVSDGERRFSAIAIANSADTPCPPCGECRQVMSEFCDGDFKVILKDKTFTLASLLPESFFIK